MPAPSNLCFVESFQERKMALSKLCNQKPEKKIERKKMSLIQLYHKRFSEIWKPALMALLEKWPCPTFPIMRRTKRNGRIRKYCCFGGKTNINHCMCNLNEFWCLRHNFISRGSFQLIFLNQRKFISSCRDLPQNQPYQELW